MTKQRNILVYHLTDKHVGCLARLNTRSRYRHESYDYSFKLEERNKWKYLGEWFIIGSKPVKTDSVGLKQVHVIHPEFNGLVTVNKYTRFRLILK